jgi:hypothetical protein
MSRIFKQKISIELILIVLLFFLNILIYLSLNTNKHDRINIEVAKYIDLSKRLNLAMKKIGQLSCNLNNGDVSYTGGWCAHISGKDSPEHKTDERFAKSLSELLTGFSIASFGDGPGVYKEIFDRLNQVKVYDAFDGAPYIENITNNVVKFLDLSVPVFHLNTYDWVISIEVAEHIPKEFETIYLDNMARHAKIGIVLSWSQEGQIGKSHVNERNFDYVKKQLEKRHFYHDEKSSNFLKENADLFWIKNNINVYRKI